MMKPQIRRNWKLIIIVLLIGTFTFSLNLLIETQFAQYNTFDQINVLFHSDPVIKNSAFVHGRAKRAWILAHPNLANFFYLPIKLTSTVINFLVDGDQKSEIRIREILALLIVPSISAVNAMTITLLFFLLKFNLSQIFFLVSLSIFSFSQTIFGSMPECFAINGLFISLTFLLSFHLYRTNSIHWIAWIILGTFGVGLTITNLIPLAAIFFVSCFSISPNARFSIRKTLVLLLASLSITFLFSTLGQLKRGSNLLSKGNVQSTKNYTLNFFDEEIIKKSVAFPAAVANSLTPGRVVVIEDPNMKDYGESERGKYLHRFTIDYHFYGIPYVFVVAFTWLVISCGAIFLFNRGDVYRKLAISSLVILAYNWVFHAVWGSEYFLYSQHWMSSVMILVSGIFLEKKRILISAASIFLIYLIANNYRTISEMMRFLEEYPPI